MSSNSGKIICKILNKKSIKNLCNLTILLKIPLQNHCLIIHLIEKYKAIAKLNKIEYGFILISFVLTDLYGLMDNTYHMFYYMIPLVILLACIDSDLYVLESNKNSDIGENEEIII